MSDPFVGNAAITHNKTIRVHFVCIFVISVMKCYRVLLA